MKTESYAQLQLSSSQLSSRESNELIKGTFDTAESAIVTAQYALQRPNGLSRFSSLPLSYQINL